MFSFIDIEHYGEPSTARGEPRIKSNFGFLDVDVI